MLFLSPVPEIPTEGQITLNGLDVRDEKQEVKKHIGVLPESTDQGRPQHQNICEQKP
jgi:ABC-type multidrug transport system ATPase subunit